MTKPPRREIEQGIYSRAFFAPREIIQNIAGWTLTKHDKKLHWNGNPNLPLFCFREEHGHWTSWVWCSNSEQVALKSIGCATITCRSVPTFQDLLVPLLQGEVARDGLQCCWQQLVFWSALPPSAQLLWGLISANRTKDKTSCSRRGHCHCVTLFDLNTGHNYCV